MPSSLPLPTIEELRKAFHDSVRGTKDRRADSHAGSIYDHPAGLGAMFFSRSAQRDKDIFGAIYFDDASGDDLTTLVSERYKIDRIEKTYGVGSMVLARPTAAGGAGTFWTGDRVRVRSAVASATYVVSEDTPVTASQLVAIVPVRAAVKGPGTAIDVASASPGTVSIDDPIWDGSWSVASLTCGDGTDYERAEALRARVKSERAAKRVGYVASIVAACVEAGAANVAAFASNFGGAALDFGVNVAYVSDGSFTTTDALRGDCIIALESVRVLGADLQVRPMSFGSMSVTCVGTTWDDPGKLDAREITSSMRSALVDHLNGANQYRLDAMAGAAMRSAGNVLQSVSFSAPSVDAPLLVGSPATFPATLTRYRVRPADVNVSLAAPA